MKYVAQAIWDTKKLADLVFGTIKHQVPAGYKDHINLVLNHIFFGFNIDNDEYYQQRSLTDNDKENTFLWVVGPDSIFDDIEDARKKLMRDIFNGVLAERG